MTSPLTPPTKTDILVVCQQLDGLGDVFGALRLSQSLIRRIGSEAQVTLAILPPSGYLFPEMVSWFSRVVPLDTIRLLHPDLCEVKNLNDLCREIDKFSLIIWYPFKGRNRMPSYLIPEKIINSHRFIGICEDGDKDSAGCQTNNENIVQLGLDEANGEHGVLLPLDAVPSPPIFDHSLASQIARLRALASLPENLSRLILEQPFSDTAIESFAQSHQLHVVYSHHYKTLLRFLGSMQGMQMCNQKRFVVIYPNVILPEHQREISEGLKMNNQYPVKYMSSDSIDFSHGNADFTIIFGKLPHSILEILLKASDQESVCTGDLSLYEHLKHRKVIAYELPPHKIPAFMSLLKLCETINPDSRLSNLLKAASIGSAPIPPNDADTPLVTHMVTETYSVIEGMFTLYQQMKTTVTLQSQYNKLIDCIFTQHKGVLHNP